MKDAKGRRQLERLGAMRTAGEEVERQWRGRCAEGQEEGGGEGSLQDAGQGARGPVRGAGASVAPGRTRWARTHSRRGGGSGGEEGARRSAPGLAPPGRPKDARTAREQVWGPA